MVLMFVLKLLFVSAPKGQRGPCKQRATDDVRSDDDDQCDELHSNHDVP